MTKAAALALVPNPNGAYGDSSWASKADYDALVAASTWADFMTALLKNPLYTCNDGAVQALYVIFNAA